ncbi:hypothetical protein N7499_009455 [Penicillium canescens]|uniref:Uncharacterized protein n=1 Tax=Penicillium canescens TaxID=5083 RepID=A0AAD6NFY9_PENCN|nr:uncharacterized protein N7446_008522 [Penicillium canescens]KAJ6019580.1 hypothetical protein N7522_001647 [Penicillium canescens]KAJ6033186.1 hypothetical protein N7444_010957 [Penicillium canescens]KAJ6057625.1 hypothetical protein N7460_000899 [Penicillium canescens]KAJ6058939.1 hypothetical protein N7446_008522 [Penicillium canescens]KAJ6071441.1 hypothetical protein N7499_009455 [Penicillium canescens]
MNSRQENLPAGVMSFWIGQTMDALMPTTILTEITSFLAAKDMTSAIATMGGSLAAAVKTE